MRKALRENDGYSPEPVLVESASSLRRPAAPGTVRLSNAQASQSLGSGVRVNTPLTANLLGERSDVGFRDTQGPVGGRAKRVLDIAIALTVILAAAPLLALIWALIRISMGYPAVFVQHRVGAGGRLFACYKFRTMVTDARQVLEKHLGEDPAAAQEWQSSRKLARDPRVTWLGRALRRSSLDELPQLFNVLRGDMSCVGPRPVVEEELERYGGRVGHYLRSRPGMTGLWQVSGRNKLSYDQRVALDSYYANYWSISMDLVILCKTLPAIAHFDETS